MTDSAIASNTAGDIFSSTFLLGNVGAPFVIGMAVGYFAKKMLRIALFVGGAILVALFVCEYYGIVDITDANLQSAATTATDAAKQSGGFLMERVTRITSKGVSGAAGFFVGLKLG
ncbi:MAG: FUN14 domain-containing protein [Methylococcales bacterium]